MRDTVRTFIPMIEGNEMPFNSMGGVTNGSYNYQSLTNGKTNSIYICEVSNSSLSYRSVVMNQIRDLNPGVFPSVCDFKLQIVRQPRQDN